MERQKQRLAREGGDLGGFKSFAQRRLSSDSGLQVMASKMLKRIGSGISGGGGGGGTINGAVGGGEAGPRGGSAPATRRGSMDDATVQATSKFSNLGRSGSAGPVPSGARRYPSMSDDPAAAMASERSRSNGNTFGNTRGYSRGYASDGSGEDSSASRAGASRGRRGGSAGAGGRWEEEPAPPPRALALGPSSRALSATSTSSAGRMVKRSSADEAGSGSVEYGARPGSVTGRTPKSMQAAMNQWMARSQRRLSLEHGMGGLMSPASPLTAGGANPLAAPPTDRDSRAFGGVTRRDDRERERDRDGSSLPPLRSAMRGRGGARVAPYPDPSGGTPSASVSSHEGMGMGHRQSSHRGGGGGGASYGPAPKRSSSEAGSGRKLVTVGSFGPSMTGIEGVETVRTFRSFNSGFEAEADDGGRYRDDRSRSASRRPARSDSESDDRGRRGGSGAGSRSQPPPSTMSRRGYDDRHDDDAYARRGYDDRRDDGRDLYDEERDVSRHGRSAAGGRRGRDYGHDAAPPSLWVDGRGENWRVPTHDAFGNLLPGAPGYGAPAVGGPSGPAAGDAGAIVRRGSLTGAAGQLPPELDLTAPGAVERPYSIVRPSNKNGLILYVRRYPRGIMSSYLYHLNEGDQVLMSGPKGMGMGLDDSQGGIVVGIVQGTCTVAVFDLLQHIWEAHEERRARRERTKRKAKQEVWSREQIAAQVARRAKLEAEAAREKEREREREREKGRARSMGREGSRTRSRSRSPGLEAEGGSASANDRLPPIRGSSTAERSAGRSRSRSGSVPRDATALMTTPAPTGRGRSGGGAASASAAPSSAIRSVRPAQTQAASAARPAGKSSSSGSGATPAATADPLQALLTSPDAAETRLYVSVPDNDNATAGEDTPPLPGTASDSTGTRSSGQERSSGHASSAARASLAMRSSETASAASGGTEDSSASTGAMISTRLARATAAAAAGAAVPIGTSEAEAAVRAGAKPPAVITIGGVTTTLAREETAYKQQLVRARSKRLDDDDDEDRRKDRHRDRERGRDDRRRGEADRSASASRGRSSERRRDGRDVGPDEGDYISVRVRDEERDRRDRSRSSRSASRGRDGRRDDRDNSTDTDSDGNFEDDRDDHGRGRGGDGRRRRSDEGDGAALLASDHDDDDDDDDEALKTTSRRNVRGRSLAPVAEDMAPDSAASAIGLDSAHGGTGSVDAGAGKGKAAGAAAAEAAKRPRFKLVLMVVAEHEDSVPEADWLRFLDENCDDFELHVNLKAERKLAAEARESFPRVTFGRLTARRLERLLPPANLLTVSICGTPQFNNEVRQLYLSMGLPRTLVSIVG